MRSGLPNKIIVGLRKSGHLSSVDMVPILGNYERMTLREYFKSGNGSMATMAYALGVSESAVRKWTYGQREPSLSDAAKIVTLTKGKVKIADLVREVAAKRGAAA